MIEGLEVGPELQDPLTLLWALRRKAFGQARPEEGSTRPLGPVTIEDPNAPRQHITVALEARCGVGGLDGAPVHSVYISRLSEDESVSPEEIGSLSFTYGIEIEDSSRRRQEVESSEAKYILAILRSSLLRLEQA